MAITSLIGSSSANTSLSNQLRIQQAQRNAERADQQARTLQASARTAQANADQAEEGARALQVQSDQANDYAGRAKLGVAVLRSAVASFSELGARAERAAEGLRARDTPAAPVAAVPEVAPGAPTTGVAASAVVNAEGQTTGTLISVTA